MTTVNVQFTDGTNTVIASVFSCPQSTVSFPNQATISTADARYISYIASLPAFLQQGINFGS